MSPMAVSPTRTEPDEGRSIPPNIFRSVDLPLPDLPVIATNSPVRISRLISRTAVNGPADVLYDLVTPCKEIMSDPVCDNSAEAMLNAPFICRSASSVISIVSLGDGFASSGGGG